MLPIQRTILMATDTSYPNLASYKLPLQSHCQAVFWSLSPESVFHSTQPVLCIPVERQRIYCVSPPTPPAPLHSRLASFAARMFFFLPFYCSSDLATLRRWSLASQLPFQAVWQTPTTLPSDPSKNWNGDKMGLSHKSRFHPTPTIVLSCFLSPKHPLTWKQRLHMESNNRGSSWVAFVLNIQEKLLLSWIVLIKSVNKRLKCKFANKGWG